MRRLAVFLMTILLLMPAVGCKSQAAVHYDRGGALDLKNDTDGAIAEYTKAIENDPTFFKAYLNRGIDRDTQNDHAGAMADFTKVIELDPTNLQAYICRGGDRIITKDLDGAVEDFTKAIELDPQMRSASYRNRAIAYKMQGKGDLAAADEKKAADSGR